MLVPDGETVAHRTDRLALRREYKKCLRVHQDHIRQGAVAQLAEAEEALDTASRQTDYSTTALQGLRDQVRNLQQYQEGLHPTEPWSFREGDHQFSKSAEHSEATESGRSSEVADIDDGDDSECTLPSRDRLEKEITSSPDSKSPPRGLLLPFFFKYR